MTYDLVKELKDAGFPKELTVCSGGRMCPLGMKKHYDAPTLSELIEACGDEFFALRRNFSAKDGKPFFWAETYHGTTFAGVASPTPEEAVAMLWLALNKK